ncbi:MAG: bifunctional oligoribonuclease and phosphatase NrnA [Thermoleophilaceae bacterium]|nr:bifunctional oligoribonuclease and phosphatase NrnA [Thermoleophilaceae bacterium]
MSTLTERDQVLDELRRADKLLLTTHENPDGDALGSLLGMHEILTQLGKDSLMFMSADEFPLPYEYRQMNLDGVLHEPPGDLDDRVVVFLDCGNIDRMPVDFLQSADLHILNIDHHHDNTRFGTVNLVIGHASCTAEIVLELGKELGAELTQSIAESLYVALVTDTGKFMFDNTTPEAHAMAAELIEVGVSPAEIHRRLYEGLPFARLQLLARALARVQRYDDGAVTLTHLTRDDFTEAGALETDSEGIVDHLRAVENTAVAVLVRDLLSPDRAGWRKASLRATDDRIDVSKIARELGGGGHRQAAGFSTQLSLDELASVVRAGVGAQLKP